MHHQSKFRPNRSMRCGDKVISRFFNMITVDHLVLRITVRILPTSALMVHKITVRILPTHLHLPSANFGLHFSYRRSASPHVRRSAFYTWPPTNPNRKEFLNEKFWLSDGLKPDLNSKHKTRADTCYPLGYGVARHSCTTVNSLITMCTRPHYTFVYCHMIGRCKAKTGL